MKRARQRIEASLRRHAGRSPRRPARALRAAWGRAPARHQLPHPYQRIVQRLSLALGSRLAGRAGEGLAVLGINDHYTVAGHDEFRQACRVAGIAATFSLEAVGMDRAAEAARLLLNDPDNPGRVYLCGKGVTRIPPDVLRCGTGPGAACARRSKRRNRGDDGQGGASSSASAWMPMAQRGKMCGFDAARQYHRAARGLGRAGPLARDRRRARRASE